MEYADKGSLADYVLIEETIDEVDDSDFLDEVELWSLMLDICLGLQHLHGVGIMHRDLKTENLLVASKKSRSRSVPNDTNFKWRVLISDFGQSKMMGTGIGMSSPATTGNTGIYIFKYLVLAIHLFIKFIFFVLYDVILSRNNAILCSRSSYISQRWRPIRCQV